MKTSKYVCLTAMFVTSLCALLCSIQMLQHPNHVMWIHLGVENETGRQVINVILLFSALVVMNCGYNWWSKKD